jgi:hypothetical protein
MSKLSSLMGKTKESVLLSNGETIELLPPTVDDFPDLIDVFKGKTGDSLTGEELSKVLKVLKRILKRSVPDATDEEIDTVLVTDLNVVLDGLTKIIEKTFGDKKK